MAEPRLVPLQGYRELPADEMRRRKQSFLETMRGVIAKKGLEDIAAFVE